MSSTDASVEADREASEPNPGSEPVPEAEPTHEEAATKPAPRLTGSRFDDWWVRLPPRWQRILRWAAPALVVVIAALTRLIGLDHPNTLVFDETYYVKDAWTLVNLGYEGVWPKNSDSSFNTGKTYEFRADPAYVVHPPLGKWIIGLGMLGLGSESPVGWRITTAIIGILAVVLLMVVARVLFRSMFLATIAGLLMAIEGNAIVMSRVALLDNSVMFFALLGVLFVLLDRNWSSIRLTAWIARREASGLPIDLGPVMLWRPWLIAAGAAFGLTSAVKWNGLYFLAAFAVYALVADALARRRAGIRFWASGTLYLQAPATFLLTVPVALAVYLASWAGWFLTDGGYDRHRAENGGGAWTGLFSWVPISLQNLWALEQSVYSYHVNETGPHSYQSSPLSWLFMVRPTSMWYQQSNLGENGCGTDICGALITGLANPIIWWAATAATLYLLYRLLRWREWQSGFILMGLVGGYLPWLLYLHRTVFQFYTIAFEPYLLLALTAVIGILLGNRTDARKERSLSLAIVALFVGLAAAVSVFFWPLWTGMQLNYDDLQWRFWLQTWR